MMKFKSLFQSNIFKFSSVLGFNQVLNFLLIFIYLKTIDSSVYGTIGLLQSYAVLIGLIAMLGIRDGFYTLYYKVDKNTLYTNVYFFVILSLIVVVTLSSYYEQAIIASFSIPKEFYSLIILYAMSNAIYSIFEITMRLEGWNNLYVYISILRGILVFSAKLYFVLHIQSDIEFIRNVLLTDIFSFTMIAVVLFIYINIRVLKFKYRVDFSLYKRLFKVSIPFLASNGSGWIFNGFDRILIERFFSLEVLGLYMYGTRIAAAVGGIIHQVVNLLYGPKSLQLLSEEKTTEMEYLGSKIKNWLKLLTLSSFVLTFIFYVSLQYLNIEEYTTISLLFLGAFLVEISKLIPKINGQKLLHLEKSHILSMLSISSSILIVIMYYLFLPVIGIGTIFLSQLLTYILITYFTHKYILIKTDYLVVAIGYSIWLPLVGINIILSVYFLNFMGA